MGKISFEADGDHLPAIALAFYQSATVILRDMSTLRGNGPWFEALREEIKQSMKGAIPEGMNPDKEVEYIEAALGAVDLVFNRIDWRG